MFDTLVSKLAFATIATGVFIGGLFGLASKNDIADVYVALNEQASQIQRLAVYDAPVGATIPAVVSLFETSLQSSISDSATSMTLVSGTDRAGNTLSGYMCFTIDEGTSIAEFVCGTASSTSVSSLTRGISPLTGTSSVASLKYAHRRGASVKITNYPQLAIISRILNGNETLPNPIRYDSGVSTTTLSSDTAYLASVAYVNGVALQGAPTATGTTAGVVILSNRTQLSNGTAMDGAYTLVPQNAFFSYTPQSATSVPVSNASGKLHQGWLDLTASWTFSGAVTHSATTTLAATSTAPLVLRNISYAFPASQGGANSALRNDGSGNLSWQALPGLASATTTFATSTFNTATTVLASLTFTPPTAQRLLITGILSAFQNTNGAGCALSVSIDDAATTTVANFAYPGGTGANIGHSLNFSYITSQVSAAQHTIKLLGRATAQYCDTFFADAPARQFSASYIGN